MKSTGKKFEEQFKKSIPKDVFYYRFRDGTASFYGGQAQEGIRFQQKNMCDAEIFKSPVLFLLELKSTKQSSLSYSSIRDNQKKELLKAKQINGICAGFVVEFSERNKCFFADVSQVENFINASERKSIPIVWFEENATEIEVIPKRINKLFNVETFIENKINQFKLQEKGE